MEKEEHYKGVYEKEYNYNKRLLGFIESLCSQTNDWDKLCDCPVADGNEENHHKDCMTMKIRHDEENLSTFPKEKQHNYR